MNNAISSGVKEAKHTQKNVLKDLGEAEKFLGPAIKNIEKALEKTVLKVEHDESKKLVDLVDSISDEIKEALQKPDTKPEVVVE